MPLTDIEREITKSVVGTFLLSRESTPRLTLVHRFEEPRALRHLVTLRILQVWDNPPNLLPTVLAFHHCGAPDILASVRAAVDVVVRALQTLFRANWEPARTYRPEDLFQVFNVSNFVPVPNQIRLGLFLVRDFDCVLSGWTTNEAHTQVETFQINEDIVTVKDVNRLWDDYVREQSSQIEGSAKPFRFDESFEEMVSTRSESRKVFVVHGHDGEAKQAVARFLERLDLEPIILHEQTNRGRTIIEKFEAHSDVAFAVVLLTPDDLGQSAVAETWVPKPRARQNVIFELGFFFAKLGRRNVCALYRGEVELPSDLGSVMYVPYDDHDGWKTKLAKEIKEAGINVDLNRV
jgi:predicted nucleotide-binding protein